jgi:hypothetical protein
MTITISVHDGASKNKAKRLDADGKAAAPVVEVISREENG